MGNAISNNKLTAAEFEVATNEIHKEVVQFQKDVKAGKYSEHEVEELKYQICKMQADVDFRARTEKTEGIFKVETWLLTPNNEVELFIPTEVATSFENFLKVYRNWYASNFKKEGVVCLKFIELNGNSEKFLFFDFCNDPDFETGTTTFLATDPTVKEIEDGIWEHDGEICVSSDELAESKYQFFGSDEILERNAIGREKYLAMVEQDEMIDSAIKEMRM